MSENGKPDVWQRLNQTLPAECISQRQGAHGRMLDYIDRPVVWERLDMVVPGEWAFTIGPTFESNNSEEPVAVRGSLTVLGVTREDIGQGKDAKEAATDAFKRCAVQFGIGRQLYAKHASGANGVRGAGPVGMPAGSEQTASAPARRPPSSRTEEALARVPKPPAPSEDEPSCPKCGGRMWDNRLSKKNPRAPDYKCRQRSCDGVIWPPREDALAAKAIAGPLVSDDEPPFPDDGNGEIPF